MAMCPNAVFQSAVRGHRDKPGVSHAQTASCKELSRACGCSREVRLTGFLRPLERLSHKCQNPVLSLISPSMQTKKVWMQGIKQKSWGPASCERCYEKMQLKSTATQVPVTRDSTHAGPTHTSPPCLTCAGLPVSLAVVVDCWPAVSTPPRAPTSFCC